MSTTPHRHQAPPANKGLLALAGVLLAIPIVALMLVGTYAKDEPRLGGFPFFIWYQFLWVFLCSALTYTAYRIVLKARPHGPMNPEGDAYLDDDASPRGRHPMTAIAPAADTGGVNGVALTVLIVLFVVVAGVGFWAARWRRPDEHGEPRRVGPRRPLVRHLDHLVPARRRPLHGLHVRRGARRRCSPSAPSTASSPCPTRSSSTRSSSSSWRGCGRSATATAT